PPELIRGTLREPDFALLIVRDEVRRAEPKERLEVARPRHVPARYSTRANASRVDPDDLVGEPASRDTRRVHERSIENQEVGAVADHPFPGHGQARIQLGDLAWARIVRVLHRPR